MEVSSVVIKEVELQTTDVVENARAIVITDDAGLSQASVILKHLSDMKKLVEERRQFFVKPLNDTVKKWNDEFKRISLPIEEADRFIRGKMQDYRVEMDRKAREEQRRLDQLAREEQERVNKEALSQGVEAPKVVAPVVAPPPKTVGNVTMRKVNRFQITDPALVPDEYWVISEAAIGSAVKSGVTAIPGVRIYQEEVPVVR